MLPEGDWKASESEAIAARLVNWLPARTAMAIPSVAIPSVAAAASGATARIRSLATTGLVWGVLAVALLFFAMHLFSNNNLEVGGGTAPSTQQ
jgi:hypothetical protein